MAVHQQAAWAHTHSGTCIQAVLAPTGADPCADVCSHRSAGLLSCRVCLPWGWGWGSGDHRKEAFRAVPEDRGWLRPVCRDPSQLGPVPTGTQASPISWELPCSGSQGPCWEDCVTGCREMESDVTRALKVTGKGLSCPRRGWGPPRRCRGGDSAERALLSLPGPAVSQGTWRDPNASRI